MCNPVAGRVRKLPLEQLKFPTGLGAASQAASQQQQATAQQQQQTTTTTQQQQQQQGRKLAESEADVRLQPGQGEVLGGSRRLANREAMCAGEQVRSLIG